MPASLKLIEFDEYSSNLMNIHRIRWIFNSWLVTSDCPIIFRIVVLLRSPIWYLMNNHLVNVIPGFLFRWMWISVKWVTWPLTPLTFEPWSMSCLSTKCRDTEPVITNRPTTTATESEEGQLGLEWVFMPRLGSWRSSKNYEAEPKKIELTWKFFDC